MQTAVYLRFGLAQTLTHRLTPDLLIQANLINHKVDFSLSGAEKLRHRETRAPLKTVSSNLAREGGVDGCEAATQQSADIIMYSTCSFVLVQQGANI